MINKSILIVIVLPRYMFVSFLPYILIPNTNKKSKIKLINVDIKIYLIVSNLFIKISINTSIKITINTIILKFVEQIISYIFKILVISSLYSEVKYSITSSLILSKSIFANSDFKNSLNS